MLMVLLQEVTLAVELKVMQKSEEQASESRSPLLLAKNSSRPALFIRVKAASHLRHHLLTSHLC
jgi:hypothetical protein